MEECSVGMRCDRMKGGVDARTGRRPTEAAAPSEELQRGVELDGGSVQSLCTTNGTQD